MKQRLLNTTLLLMAIVLWGCPYKSSVPLSEATENVNKQMLGRWVPQGMEDKENPEYYLIEQRDTLHYDVAHYLYSDEGKEYSVKNYVGHTTRLENILFMNLQESGTKEYLIYRLDLSDGTMTKYEVTNNIDEQFNDSQKLREFVQKYMRLSFFYNADEVELVRK
ncbi:MAG: hypothetical protein RL266_1948 [Bacteroidota bacterium]|jgi:hypothetical protein